MHRVDLLSVLPFTNHLKELILDYADIRAGDLLVQNLADITGKVASCILINPPKQPQPTDQLGRLGKKILEARSLITDTVIVIYKSEIPRKTVIAQELMMHFPSVTALSNIRNKDTKRTAKWLFRLYLQNNKQSILSNLVGFFSLKEKSYASIKEIQGTLKKVIDVSEKQPKAKKLMIVVSGLLEINNLIGMGLGITERVLTVIKGMLNECSDDAKSVIFIIPEVHLKNSILELLSHNLSLKASSDSSSHDSILKGKLLLYAVKKDMAIVGDINEAHMKSVSLQVKDVETEFALGDVLVQKYLQLCADIIKNSERSPETQSIYDEMIKKLKLLSEKGYLTEENAKATGLTEGVYSRSFSMQLVEVLGDVNSKFFENLQTLKRGFSNPLEFSDEKMGMEDEARV